MPELEKTIEARVTKWAKQEGWLCEKVKFGNGGYPDRIYMKNGITAFIEFKRPGKKPTPLQLERIRELNAHAIHAIWTSSSDHAIEWLYALSAGLVSS